MILVTGGTGFVGQEVVRELITKGYTVRLLVRNAQRAHRFAHHPQVQLVQGDALRPETLTDAMKGVSAVINLIGIIAETSRTTFEQGHVEATRHLLAAAQVAGVTRWLQMSAAGTRPGANSRYHLTKWQAEEWVRQSGLDWTVFRPSLIYGYDEQDRLLNLLRLLLSWPLNFLQLYSFPLLEGGSPLIQPVSVREVAHCFVRSLSSEASIGQTYELVGPSAFSWREMLVKIAAALGKRVIYEEVPILLPIRALLWLAAVLLPVLMIAALALGKWNLAEAEVGTGLWLALLVIATRWTELILFNVPAAPLLAVGEILSVVAPRSLQFGEQLKMAVEDNTGDPLPAAAAFDYIPESFEHGLETIYGQRS